ncbi:beta-1,3-glucanase family protein [Dongshaea marina]|uniref:beta-1,3-glucanase family protein n=1 Tax=Dongshaea marina TaxID=2047966 RepID=UPI000D3EB7C5|nr:beta-1,3-glucanase family protein [Dongshaea marina]
MTKIYKFKICVVAALVLIFCGHGAVASTVQVNIDLSQVNNQAVNLDSVYLLVSGKCSQDSPYPGKPCYISFDQSGEPTYKPASSVKSSKDESVLLSKLPKDGKQAYIKVPHLESGRIWLSIGKPLDMKTNKDGSIEQPNVTPDVLNAMNANSAILYDKFEFTFGLKDGGYKTVINTTSVDFASLPYMIHQKDTVPVMPAAGYGRGGDMLAQMEKLVPDWSSSSWAKLVQYEYIDNQPQVGNGATDAAAKNLLRIHAPGRDSMKQYWPKDYLVPYLEKIQQHYTAQNKQGLRVTINTDQSTWYGTFSGSVLSFNKYSAKGNIIATESFDFSDDSGHSVSDSIFMGAEGIFSASGQNPPTAKDELAKALTATIQAGLLMRTKSVLPIIPPGKDQISYTDLSPEVVKRVERKYLYNQGGNFVSGYTPNICGTGGEPCTNIYAAAMHAFGDAVTYPNVYGFAYADYLGLDSTATSSNFSPATVIISFGDMQGRVVEHPGKVRIQSAIDGTVTLVRTEGTSGKIDAELRVIGANTALAFSFADGEGGRISPRW